MRLLLTYRTFAALVGIVCLFFAFGCATGTVQTVNGPRPAAEVQAQDLAADVLSSLGAAYSAAVAIHDDPATVANESPEVHAKHRAALLTERDALMASWKVLLLWKQTAGSQLSPASVMQPMLDSLPMFLDLAVDLKVLTREKADSIAAYVKLLFPPKMTLRDSRFTNPAWGAA